MTLNQRPVIAKDSNYYRNVVKKAEGYINDKKLKNEVNEHYTLNDESVYDNLEKLVVELGDARIVWEYSDYRLEVKQSEYDKLYAKYGSRIHNGLSPYRLVVIPDIDW